jgi:hypothetical protein
MKTQNQTTALTCQTKPMKTNPEKLNNILDLQKQVEEFKGNFIKQIDYYELPFSRFNGLSEVTIQPDGLEVEYFIEYDNIPETAFLPWEYFDDKSEYINTLNVEEEKRRKIEEKITAEARLKLAEKELEEAKKLSEAYQQTFGDVE